MLDTQILQISLLSYTALRSQTKNVPALKLMGGDIFRSLSAHF